MEETRQLDTNDLDGREQRHVLRNIQQIVTPWKCTTFGLFSHLSTGCQISLKLYFPHSSNDVDHLSAMIEETPSTILSLITLNPESRQQCLK